MESVPRDVFADSSTTTSYNVPRIILRPQNGILMTGRSGSTTMNYNLEGSTCGAYEGLRSRYQVTSDKAVGFTIDDQVER